MVIQKIRVLKDVLVNCRRCRQGEVIPLGKYGITGKQARDLIEKGEAATYSTHDGHNHQKAYLTEA